MRAGHMQLLSSCQILRPGDGWTGMNGSPTLIVQSQLKAVVVETVIRRPNAGADLDCRVLLEDGTLGWLWATFLQDESP